MYILKVVVEADQQALSQVDILFRDNDTQCESTQYEDGNCDGCTDKYSLRIIFGRILHILHMDTAHFHTGIEKENTGCKYQIVEITEIGEEVTVKVHLTLSARCQIDNCQHHQ